MLRGDPEMIDITPDGERGVIQDELPDLNTLKLKNWYSTNASKITNATNSMTLPYAANAAIYFWNI